MAMTPSPSSPNTESDSFSGVGHSHQDVVGGWLRPAVFGAVDGLVSNFALIAAIGGANPHSSKPVLLAGLAGLFGGALSMAGGEYISVRSQGESMQAEVELERRELTYNPEAELEELTEIYVARGVDRDLAKLVAEQLSANVDQALVVHAQEELGVDIYDLPSSRLAAVSSFLSFSLGALIPLLPYLFASNVLPISAALALVGLFVTGAVTSRFTVRSWRYAGIRQVAVGVFAAAVTYGIGHLFGATVG